MKRVTLNTGKSTILKHVDFYDGTADVNRLGAGDSYYIRDFYEITPQVFIKLLDEISFVQMFNVQKTADAVPIPRLVSAQTSKDTLNSPHYRMPGCNQGNIPTTPWTPTVAAIRDAAEIATGQTLNHCVINMYWDKDSSLSFHKDNLLDLEPGTGVISVSVGQTRPLLFHAVETNHRQTVNLHNGSLLYIGTQTNRRYVHAIPKLTDTVEPRISLTFRHIASFINNSSNEITGQGIEFQSVDYPCGKCSSDNVDIQPANREQINQLIAKIQAATD